MASLKNSDDLALSPDMETNTTAARGRKRKIDKDGFVCPTTPDIPKTSCQYPSETMRIQREDDTDDTRHLLNSADTGSYRNDSDLITISGPDHDQTQGSVSSYFPCSIGSDDTQFYTNQPTEQGAALQDGEGCQIQNLIKDFGQETSALHEHWGKIFRQSEMFEMYCPQKLDLFIEEAGSLEATLNRQKDVLCSRLKGIGQSIDM